jgi:hypothetical protein
VVVIHAKRFGPLMEMLTPVAMILFCELSKVSGVAVLDRC